MFHLFYTVFSLIDIVSGSCGCIDHSSSALFAIDPQYAWQYGGGHPKCRVREQMAL